MDHFVFDPYIVRAVSSVTAEQVNAVFPTLYPDMVSQAPEDRAADLELIGLWLVKLRKNPGLALSTGRRNSDKGMFTCSLLDVLGVTFPKGARTRMLLAWEIMDSPIGRQNIGDAPKLEAQRKLRDEPRMQQIQNNLLSTTV